MQQEAIDCATQVRAVPPRPWATPLWAGRGRGARRGTLCQSLEGGRPCAVATGLSVRCPCSRWDNTPRTGPWTPATPHTRRRPGPVAVGASPAGAETAPGWRAAPAVTECCYLSTQRDEQRHGDAGTGTAAGCSGVRRLRVVVNTREAPDSTASWRSGRALPALCIFQCCGVPPQRVAAAPRGQRLCGWEPTRTHCGEGLTTTCICRSPQALEKYNIEKDIASYIKKEVRVWLRDCGLGPCCPSPSLTHPMRAAPPPAVRQEVRPHVALHCGPQLRVVCDPRDEALPLHVPGPGGGPALQERLMEDASWQ
jgi:hypothetical protein